MIYSIEKISEIWHEILPNLKKYYEQTSICKQGDFKPDYERFKTYEDIGFFVLFTARHEGKLAGHCGMYLTRSMYTQEMVAIEDGWFMDEKYRKLTNPIKSIQIIEDKLFEMGVKQISMTTELKMSGIMKRLGYTQIANQYSKYLGGADSTIEDQTIGKNNVVTISATCS